MLSIGLVELVEMGGVLLVMWQFVGGPVGPYGLQGVLGPVGWGPLVPPGGVQVSLDGGAIGWWVSFQQGPSFPPPGCCGLLVCHFGLFGCSWPGVRVW